MLDKTSRQMVSSLNSGGGGGGGGQPAGGVRAAAPNPEVAYQAQLQQLTQVIFQIFHIQPFSYRVMHANATTDPICFNIQCRKLTQLKNRNVMTALFQMGFVDAHANLQALISTNGDLNSAIERLLQQRDQMT